VTEPSRADILIEAARPDDAAALLVVQRSAYVSEAQRYGDPFIPPLVETLDEVVAAIASGGVIVARLDGRLVGSVRGHVVDGVCHVGRLSVVGDLQGRRIGSRLLSAVEEALTPTHVTSYTLFTGADSPDNIRLYERHGYRATHVEPLNDRVSFVHMSKPAAGITPAGSA
jgi:GNAT superfamily N-acetyltransferase